MALSTVLHKPFLTQIVSVSVVAIIATIGVYGLVALIVKIDDAGYFLQKKSSRGHFLFRIGQFLILLLPQVIKALAVIGTIALLTVAGGIFLHHIPFLLPWSQSFPMPELIWSIILGLVGGFIAFLMVLLYQKLRLAIK